VTIRRLRLAFAALAVALAIPGALLVKRALSSVALEREARDRAVAERVFDVMESSLSALLAAEEARPASDYDFASAASPLREPPEEAIALGWFEIEAGGRVSTPAWARRVAPLAEEIAADGARLEAAPAAARSTLAAGDAPARAELAGESERVAAAPAFPAAPVRDERAPAARAPTAVPVTRATASDAAPAQPVDDPAAAESKQEAPSDAYDALAKLNVGAKQREARAQRVYVEEDAAQAAFTAAEAAPGPVARASDSASQASAGASARDRAQAIVAEALAAPAPQAEAERSAPPADEASSEAIEHGAIAQAAPGSGDAAGAKDSPRRAEAGAFAPAPSSPPSASAEARPSRGERPANEEVRAAERAEARPGAAERAAGRPGAAARSAARSAEAFARLGEPARSAVPAQVRVVVDPLRGRIAKSGELLLVRSAWIGDRGVRQGVAYDLAALERALGTQALAATLPEGRIAIVPHAAARDEPPLGEGIRVFEHRFAEPFDDFAASLSFAPLADSGAQTVTWLAALLALAGAGGLFAVYRMTAVALHFAERRSNFAAAVSHELKTPLTAIRLYAEMLRDGLVASDEKRREYYGSIGAETERLSRLIDNVLELARLEKGKRNVELRAGDAGAVAREAVELLRPHAAAHGLSLELTVEDGLPPVRFERDALLQIVFNLVDNAVKYGRGEVAKIEVACRRSGAGVVVAVRDHGPGVPRDELQRILEPFYRRGDELTRGAPGAGIGLALVRSLAQEMGAALAVANAVGGGLEVAVTLPAAA
jgi:signal transduction histidine kinase